MMEQILKPAEVGYDSTDPEHSEVTWTLSYRLNQAIKSGSKNGWQTYVPLLPTDNRETIEKLMGEAGWKPVHPNFAARREGEMLFLPAGHRRTMPHEETNPS